MCRFSEVNVKGSGKTEVVGNETMLGQVASFMENLHLSYKEVVEVIPYRNLIIMQKDKLHTVSSEDVMQEVSEEEFLRNKSKRY